MQNQDITTREIIAKIYSITQKAAKLEDDVIRFQVDMARFRQNLWEGIKDDGKDDNRQDKNDNKS